MEDNIIKTLVDGGIYMYETLTGTSSLNYRQRTPFDQRVREASRCITEHPGCRPVILLPVNVRLARKKYLVPENITVDQLIADIRVKNSSTVSYSTGLYFFTGRDTLPSRSCTIGRIYQDFRDDDGFLYFSVHVEKAFGGI